MKIAVEQTLGRDESLELYEAVDWNGYTKDPDKLLRSLAGSHVLLTAWEADGRLIGIARTVSDDETFCYVQDLLVHPTAQRRGVGRSLMSELKQRYAHCRFFILSTDGVGTEDARKSHPFYRAMGLIPHEEQGMAAFGLPVRR